ncbi:MAG: HisA/HisF-related TIM barrel protein [Candidatus Omnitrophica bacterium]|nr:HisA/HisF-related TIM barrel protein [Candidatus Omnitrophota bacterium]
MIIIPAIDLKKNEIVRLCQGKFEKSTSYPDNPVNLVKEFIVKGAKRIHVICLLGAKDGKIEKDEERIIQKIIETRNIFGHHCGIQLGGGIRRIEEIEYFFNLGIDYLIISTGIILPFILESGFSIGDIKLFYQRGGKKFEQQKELPEIDLLNKLDSDIKKKIIVGVDFYNNHVALSGWQVLVPLQPSYIINKFIDKGFEQFILTDVSRDGTMEGIDIPGLKDIFENISGEKILNQKFFIAGGIKNEIDVQNIHESNIPVFGVVIGKALYETFFDLKQVIKQFQ